MRNSTVMASAIACGAIVSLIGCRASETLSTALPELTATPTVVVLQPRPPVPTSTPRPVPSDLDIAARDIMFRFYLFSQRPFSNHTQFDPDPDLAAIDEAGELGHTGLVMPLVDTASLTLDDQTASHVARALKNLTGQEFGGYAWSTAEWYRWIGEHPEIQAPPDYDRWKGTLFAQFDLSLENFIYRDVPARVDMWAIQWGGVGPFDIPPLDEPDYVPATDMEADYLERDELVIGVRINGDARAFPLRLMDHHEIVNDTVGGVPVVLSASPVNGTSTLYATSVGDRTYTFGTSGYLYQGDKLLFDRATRSLWHAMTGEPVVGRLALSGIKMTRLPITVTDWTNWKETHPDTTVLSIDTGYVRDYRNPLDPDAPYGAYKASPRLMFPVYEIDHRTAPKTPVLGLQSGGAARAWRVYDLWIEGIVNDAVGDTPVVLITDPASGAVRAYERAGETFTNFARRGESTEKLLIDRTGGSWTITEGQLVKDDDPEIRLNRIAGVNAFWSAWYAFNPNTSLRDRPQ